MPQRRRRILIAAAAIVLVVIVGVPVLLWMALDEEQLRARAARYVKQQTGRELTIAGPIGLSFLPWLGAELHDVSLGEPGQAGGPAAARFGTLGVKVKVFPLLRREIQVGGIVGSGGTLRAGGYELRDVALSTGAFGGAAPAPLDLRFTIVAPGGSPVPATLEGPMVLDIARQVLDLPSLSGSIGDMTFEGKLAGRSVLDAPALDGRIETGRFDLRALLAQLGIAYAPADRKAMTAASLSARVISEPAKLELRDFALSLDGSRLTGRATLPAARRGTTPEWDIALLIDSIDVDRYLPGAAAPAAPAAPSAADPYESLRRLAARANVTAQQLKAFGLQFAGVSAHVTARDGVLRVTPLRASLYGGSGELSAAMDVRHPSPAYHAEGRLSHVDVQPLLAAAQGIEVLSGTGDVALAVDAAGNDPRGLTRSMDGRVSLSVRDGRLEGVDFFKMLAQARAVADQLRGRPVAAQGDPADRTKFSSLSGTAAIQNGVARNDDLRLQAPDLQATGAGTIDLVQQRIEYALRAASDQAGNVVVPIAIRGPFDRPAYQIQAGAMLKEAAEQELKKQMQKRLKGILKIP